MITSKQRAALRSMASGIEPVFQIGKEEISENQLSGIGEALGKRELIKINVLKSSSVSAKEAAQIISGKLNAETVAVTGNKVVIYKRSVLKEVKHIEF